MAIFKVGDKEYDTKDLSPEQTELLSILTLVKQLTNEYQMKNTILSAQKKAMIDEIKQVLGSNIVEINLAAGQPTVTLEDNTELQLDAIDGETAEKIRALSDVDLEASEKFNLVQVLDTAKITYSKQFYLTLQ